MSNTVTATDPAPQSRAGRRRNHLATTVIAALYVALLINGIVLAVRDFRAPVASSEPSSTAPAAGSSAGWPLPSHMRRPAPAAERG
jgi:hypothetical protein